MADQDGGRIDGSSRLGSGPVDGSCRCLAGAAYDKADGIEFEGWDIDITTVLLLPVPLVARHGG